MPFIGFTARFGSIFTSMSFAVIGCDGPMQPAPETQATSRAPAASAPATPSRAEGNPSAESIERQKSATEGRKIIYNAQVDLVTEDLKSLETTLNKLVTAQKAYIADSERSGTAGATLHGSWKVRVPVEGYDVFLRGVVALGELVSLKADSQDVSEVYFDLDARQAAKKVEESRLLKHLTDSTGKLEEILAVERELSRVRSEIEQMQGRLRVLANLSALATVTITAREIKDYVPPQAPTLGTRIKRTFSASVDLLLQVGEAVLLFLVGITPWLPIILLALGIALWVSRRSARRTSPTDREGVRSVPAPPKVR